MRPDSCRCTTTSLSARYARSAPSACTRPRPQQLATIGLVAARQHVVDVGEHLVGQDVRQEAESAAVDADERDAARERELRREQQGAVAADRHDEVRLLRRARRPACGRARPAGPRSAAVAVEEHREVRARAGVWRAAPASRRPGRLPPCRPGRCAKSDFSSGMRGFLARETRRRPQSLTLDERDC